MPTPAARAGAASLPPWGTVIVAVAAAVAGCLVAARWVLWPDPSTRPDLGQRIGPASWSFGDSWASTLTAFGAILGALLLTMVLPESGRYTTVRTVALLDLIFGFLVVLAPFVYAATGSPVTLPPVSPDTTPVVSYEGRALTFLVAAAITLWAALGEIATLVLASAELSFPGALFFVFATVLLAVAALMLAYAWRSIRAVLEVQREYEVLLAVEPSLVPSGRPRWTAL